VVFGALVLLANLVFDYAKVRAVVEDRRHPSARRRRTSGDRACRGRCTRHRRRARGRPPPGDR
jgi:hypothetical protein